MNDHTFVLIDVGSANGIYPLFKNFLKYPTEIHTFEPEPDGLANNLNTKFINNNFGLSDKKENTNLYLTEKLECSSLLKPNMNLLKKYYNPERFEINSSILIDVMRFDEYFKGDHIDIIKLDTQGTEYEILKGCGDTLLSKTKCIITEAEFVEMYTDQKLFIDLSEYLFSIGFRILKFLRIVFASNKRYYQYDTRRYTDMINRISNKRNSNVPYLQELLELMKRRHEIIMRILKVDDAYINIDNINEINNITNKIIDVDELSILDKDTMMFCDVVYINTNLENDIPMKTIMKSLQ